jgi:hypothetical protein
MANAEVAAVPTVTTTATATATVASAADGADGIATATDNATTVSNQTPGDANASSNMANAVVAAVSTVTTTTTAAAEASIQSTDDTPATSDSLTDLPVNDGSPSSAVASSRKRSVPANRGRPNSSPLTNVAKQARALDSADKPDATVGKVTTSEKLPETIPDPYCQRHRTGFVHLRIESTKKDLKYYSEKGRYLALAKCQECRKGKDYLVTCASIHFCRHCKDDHDDADADIVTILCNECHGILNLLQRPAGRKTRGRRG